MNRIMKRSAEATNPNLLFRGYGASHDNRDIRHVGLGAITGDKALCQCTEVRTKS
jgi:hypothetical protein